ncbi:MAG: toxin-antitoxin system YwqK family antitoxin [Bacteroidia bacterium]
MQTIKHHFKMKYFFVLCLLANSLIAQNRQGESYTVYLNNSGESIKAEVVFENKKIKAKEDLTYYWYVSNKIIETKGGYDGRMLDGPYTSFYLSDNIKEQGVFKNGLKDSEWKSWYENGKLKEITTWDHGVKYGSCKKFDLHGNLTTEANYKNGKLNGYEISYDGEKITGKKKYSKGIEIIKPIKKASVKDSTATEKKINFFRKKRKDEPINKKQKKTDKKKDDHQKIDKPVESANIKASEDKKEKRSFKNSISNIFRKRKKSATLVKNESPEK